jgi:hypothetical protein
MVAAGRVGAPKLTAGAVLYKPKLLQGVTYPILNRDHHVKTALVRELRFIPAVLLLGYTSCKGDGGTDPSTATTIEASSQTTVSGVAGTAVSPAPSVIVRDQNGEPFAGAPVTFNVGGGGGTVTGASVVTTASGVATVGSWTLGAIAGPNTLTATSGTLTVSFSASGVAGPTSRLTVSAGDNQVGAPGAAVTIAPAVLVQDANGNAKAGVTVTFAVGEGGGSVTAGTATSNASGIAAVGSWTLGPSAGSNSLVASTSGAPSVTFHATAAVSACSTRTALALGSSSGGALATSDCLLSAGYYIDFFSTVLPDAGAYLFSQTAAFDTYLDLSLADGTVIAENDDATDNSTNSAIKALLPAGTYVMGASSFDPAVTGNYTVSSQVTSPDNANCELVFVVKNVTTTQGLAASDCLLTTPPDAPIYGDGFYILLRAGQSITVDMSSSVVDSYLTIVRGDGTTMAQNDNKDATTKDARITFTAATANYYAIVARTAIASQTGAYTLAIQ